MKICSKQSETGAISLPQAITTAFSDLSDKNLIEPSTHYILCFRDFVDLGGYGVFPEIIAIYCGCDDFGQSEG